MGNRRKLTSGSWAGLLASLVLLSACSVADFKKPVDDMALAVGDSITTIDKIDQRMTAARNKQLKAGMAKRTVILETVSRSCNLKAGNCALEAFERKADGTLVSQGPFPVASIIPKARAGLTGLKTYTANLQAIIAADTVNKVTASANSALGSLANIETSIEKAGGPKAGTVAKFSESGSAAINWFIGQYVDFVKVRALRKATGEAQPVIERLAEFYNLIGDSAALYGLGDAQRKYIAAQEAFDAADNPNAAAVDAYVKAASAYDQSLRAVSARPLKVFAEAHGKLARHLSGSEVSLADAMAAVENLVARAKAFKAVVEKVEADIANN